MQLHKIRDKCSVSNEPRRLWNDNIKYVYYYLLMLLYLHEYCGLLFIKILCNYTYLMYILLFIHTGITM